MPLGAKNLSICAIKTTKPKPTVIKHYSFSTNLLLFLEIIDSTKLFQQNHVHVTFWANAYVVT